MARIYISYAREDRDLVEVLSSRLKISGHKVFSDLDLVAGDIWRNTVQNNIHKADIALFIISKYTFKSQWLAFEAGAALAYFRESRNPIVMPIVIDSAQLPPMLTELHSIFATRDNLLGLVNEISLEIKIATSKVLHRELRSVERPIDSLLNELPSNQIASVKFRGHESLPPWAIMHYFSRLSIFHMKLILTQRICELTARGFSDEDFKIGSHSSEMFPTGLTPKPSIDGFLVLSTKSESAEMFWHYLRRLHRPIVRVRYQNDWSPLYLPSSPEALRIARYKESSPPLADIQGLAGALIDLIYAKDRERRDRIDWQNQQVGQSAGNLEQIVRASQIINNPDTPPGVRRYAEQQLNWLLQKQGVLNENFGIEIEGINTTG